MEVFGRRYSLVLGLVVSLLIMLVLGVALNKYALQYCENLLNGGHVLIDAPDVAPGYVLVAPYIGGSFYSASGEVELLDQSGQIVHVWHTQYQALYSILEPDGDLYVAMTPSINVALYPSGGTTGEIEELDWSGNVLWKYTDPEMTHDFEVLPNGDVAYTRWEKAPQSFAQNVVGGMQTGTSSVWTDGIVVVNPQKQIVWQWHTYDHLDPADFPLGPFTPRSDWSHLNSLRYTDDNPITHTPAYLISMRHINTVFLIDAKSGNVIWQSPKGLFAFQHDATLLQNGDIMVFDNGFDRAGSTPYLASRVVELNPSTDKIVWQYNGGSTGGEQVQFASSIMGGAQRLANGDTFITDSDQNKILEVDSVGNVVWEYFNDAATPGGRHPIVFKSRKYDPAGTTWANYIHPTLSKMVCEI